MKKHILPIGMFLLYVVSMMDRMTKTGRIITVNADVIHGFHCTGKVLVENCRFENTPIMFTGDTDYWYENAPVRDVTIQNNVFEYYPTGIPISSSPVFEATHNAPYYHSGFKILDNTFIDCRRGIIKMENTDGITLRGNTCENGCNRALQFDSCDHIQVENGKENGI